LLWWCPFDAMFNNVRTELVKGKLNDVIDNFVNYFDFLCFKAML